MFFGSGDSFLLIIIPIALAIWAQSSLMKNFRTYSQLRTHRNISGEQAARYILDRHGLTNVPVVRSNGGTLSNFFDPVKNVVNLSSEVYDGYSVASVAVAAHEVGHAIQHQERYSVIDIRNKILPAAQIASSFSWVAIMIGLITGFMGMFYTGIILLGVIALFQLVTLPLEFDASNRALKNLQEYSLLDSSELVPARKVLKSAAMTYIIALVGTMAQIARLLLVSNNRRR